MTIEEIRNGAPELKRLSVKILGFEVIRITIFSQPDSTKKPISTGELEFY